MAEFEQHLVSPVAPVDAGHVSEGEQDVRLTQLWSPKLSEALELATRLYAPLGDEGTAQSAIQEEAPVRFWRLLTRLSPNCPDTFLARFATLVHAVELILRVVRQNPDDSFADEWLAMALRPIRRLSLGMLSGEVCEALYDYRRGVWSPYLSPPQLLTIEKVLALTVAALPPDEMTVFWQGLKSEDGMRRSAMLLGLRYLRSAHSVPHLLHGLEHLADHAARAAIVDCLEQIGEASALDTMARLRRETAETDWTLSRHIARAIRVIEQQNQGRLHQTLLRPASAPREAERLLRPASLGEPDIDALLRAAEKK